MTGHQNSAGTASPRVYEIEVGASELAQLFSGIDPSPLRAKDLDANVEEYIVGWAREAPRNAQLALMVHLDHASGPGDEALMLRDALRSYFQSCSDSERRRLRHRLETGRKSLIIGLAFLTLATAVGQLLARRFADATLSEILRTGLSVGGWVAMWRPLEIFLYDWWPIRAEARLFDRLSAMEVRVQYVKPDAPNPRP